MSLELPDGVRFDAAGLVPVVVQQRSSGDVLMVAYANAAALEQTASSGWAHFWSRSRQELWKKGATSGNLLKVHGILADCDGDTLIYVADPAGPTCHTGVRTCFGAESPTAAGVLDEIARVIAERAADGPVDSYTTQLLAGGLDHCLKKVGEEATELVLAAKGESDERVAEETADLLYHVLVVLHQRGIALDLALDVLRERRKAP